MATEGLRAWPVLFELCFGKLADHRSILARRRGPNVVDDFHHHAIVAAQTGTRLVGDLLAAVGWKTVIDGKQDADISVEILPDLELDDSLDRTADVNERITWEPPAIGSDDELSHASAADPQAAQC